MSGNQNTNPPPPPPSESIALQIAQVQRQQKAREEQEEAERVARATQWLEEQEAPRSGLTSSNSIYDPPVPVARQSVSDYARYRKYARTSYLPYERLKIVGGQDDQVHSVLPVRDFGPPPPPAIHNQPLIPPDRLADFHPVPRGRKWNPNNECPTYYPEKVLPKVNQAKAAIAKAEEEERKAIEAAKAAEREAMKNGKGKSNKSTASGAASGPSGQATTPSGPEAAALGTGDPNATPGGPSDSNDTGNTTAPSSGPTDPTAPLPLPPPPEPLLFDYCSDFADAIQQRKYQASAWIRIRLQKILKVHRDKITAFSDVDSALKYIIQGFNRDMVAMETNVQVDIQKTKEKCGKNLDKAKLCIRYGDRYAKEREYPIAIICYSKAICCAPYTIPVENYPDQQLNILQQAYLSRGEIFYKIGKYHNSFYDASTLLRMSSAFVDVSKLYIKSCLRIAQDDIESALEAFDEGDGDADIAAGEIVSKAEKYLQKAEIELLLLVSSDKPNVNEFTHDATLQVQAYRQQIKESGIQARPLVPEVSSRELVSI